MLQSDIKSYKEIQSALWWKMEEMDPEAVNTHCAYRLQLCWCNWIKIERERERERERKRKREKEQSKQENIKWGNPSQLLEIELTPEAASFLRPAGMRLPRSKYSSVAFNWVSSGSLSTFFMLFIYWLIDWFLRALQRRLTGTFLSNGR